MVDRICVVLEALSIAVCLHRLYGKKFRFDIATVSLMTIEMIMMQAIDYFGWPKELSMLFYLVVVGYCVIEFGFDIKKIIVNNVLYLAILGGLQISIMMIFYIFRIQQMIIGIKPLISNCIILLITIFFPVKFKVNYTTLLYRNREKILIISFGVCAFIVAIFLISFKRFNLFTYSDLFQYILLFSCIVLIGVMSTQLVQYKIKSKEVETELKMHKLYANSFDNLIDNIRYKQHEFDNHINTIYSQHYIYDTYEGLVNAQKNYCVEIGKNNKFNKLLVSGNPIIIGFLYGKFVEIDRFGISISYQINIGELQVGIPIYKLVEILGNLIGNAVDALICSHQHNKLFVFLEEEDKRFAIEVRNESNYINYSEIELFFTKGYSKKGENRGIGLFHVKAICEEYELKLSCQNKEVDRTNWISFFITNKKETT